MMQYLCFCIGHYCSVMICGLRTFVIDKLAAIVIVFYSELSLEYRQNISTVTYMMGANYGSTQWRLFWTRKYVTKELSTLLYWISKIQGHLLIWKEEKSSSETIIRDNHLTKRNDTRYPTSSCKNILIALLRNGTDVSSITVSRHLRFQSDLKSFKLSRKSQLTAAMKNRHLAFPNQSETWTRKNGTDIFSDKSTVQKFVMCLNKHCKIV